MGAHKPRGILCARKLHTKRRLNRYLRIKTLLIDGLIRTTESHTRAENSDGILWEAHLTPVAFASARWDSNPSNQTLHWERVWECYSRRTTIKWPRRENSTEINDGFLKITKVCILYSIQVITKYRFAQVILNIGIMEKELCELETRGTDTTPQHVLVATEYLTGDLLR